MQICCHAVPVLKQIPHTVSVKRGRCSREMSKAASQMTLSQMSESCNLRLPPLGRRNQRIKSRNCQTTNNGHHHNCVPIRWQTEQCLTSDMEGGWYPLLDSTTESCWGQWTSLLSRKMFCTTDGNHLSTLRRHGSWCSLQHFAPVCWNYSMMAHDGWSLSGVKDTRKRPWKIWLNLLSLPCWIMVSQMWPMCF